MELDLTHYLIFWLNQSCHHNCDTSPPEDETLPVGCLDCNFYETLETLLLSEVGKSHYGESGSHPGEGPLVFSR